LDAGDAEMEMTSGVGDGASRWKRMWLSGGGRAGWGGGGGSGARGRRQRRPAGAMGRRWLASAVELDDAVGRGPTGVRVCAWERVEENGGGG
jgi:hypothetical protein